MTQGNCCSRCWRRFGRWWLHCFLRWRLWIRPFVMLGYAVVLLIVIPLLFVNCLGDDDKCDRVQRTQLIGGIFALIALPITFWEITQHLVHYTKPYLQKHVIRILWMVPIYALDAWLGLIVPKYAIYMNAMRECYEAYVIYNFMKFLLNYLNAEMDLEANLELKPQVHHFVPLCCMRDWEMGREFIHKCKHGILQYTVFRPLTTFISFVCDLSGVYGEGVFKPDNAFPYMLFVNNVSQFVAMYCLVLFYKATRDELAPMKPIGKFLCIKAVVFFSFFQGMGISILINLGLLDNIFGTTNETNPQDISASLQNFLICIEMFLAAIAHHYAFSYKAYVDLAAEQPNCCQSFCQMWDVSDVKDDVYEHVGAITTQARSFLPSKVYRHPGGLREERAHLLSSGEAADYSGDSGVSTSTLPRPLQAARSASLQLVAEMENTESTSLLEDSDGSGFLDLTDTISEN